MLKYKATFDEQRPAGFDGVWCFEWVSDVLPNRIAPMDIDGLIERNGEFLIIETKKPGVSVPTGQFRALCALVERAGATIIICNGKPGETELVGLRTITPWGQQEWCPNKETFQAIVRQWWKRANGKRIR